MPGVGPAWLVPPAVAAVSSLKAVSLRLSLPGGLFGAIGPQFWKAVANYLPGTTELVQAVLQPPA